MSRSNNEQLVNPAKRFFEWSGSEGKIKWYDKETKENVYIDLPFTFLVLDTLVTITGYSDADQSGYWSNEIRSTQKDELTVRTKHGIAKRGLYSEVKDLVGAKYTQSVYIAYRGENGLEIGNLKLSGSAIGPWIEFRKGRDIYSGAVAVTGKTQEKKGANKYFAPVFEAKTTSEETNARANELDQELQAYLIPYLNRQPEVAQAASVNGNGQSDWVQEPPDDLPTTHDDEIPF